MLKPVLYLAQSKEGSTLAVTHSAHAASGNTGSNTSGATGSVESTRDTDKLNSTGTGDKSQGSSRKRSCPPRKARPLRPAVRQAAPHKHQIQ